jgi:hypothetical protein
LAGPRPPGASGDHRHLPARWWPAGGRRVDQVVDGRAVACSSGDERGAGRHAAAGEGQVGRWWPASSGWWGARRRSAVGCAVGSGADDPSRAHVDHHPVAPAPSAGGDDVRKPLQAPGSSEMPRELDEAWSRSSETPLGPTDGFAAAGGSGRGSGHEWS